MHVTGGTSDATGAAASSSSSSSNVGGGANSFKMKLPTVDIQDCSTDLELVRPTPAAEVDAAAADDASLDDEMASFSFRSGGFQCGVGPAQIKSPSVLTPPHSTPRSSSPVRSPTLTTTASNSQTQFLAVGNPSSIFRLPKPQVKLLKKTASVRQLYKSVLHAIKTIASARDDITPELTKTFFENILRTSDESPKLQVTKVKVKDGTEFGRHFCSEVHAVEVTAKVKLNGEGGGSEVRKYHLIVKSQPQNEDARRFLKPSRTFEKEVQMYGQVYIIRENNCFYTFVDKIFF